MNLWQAFKMAFKSISNKKTRSFLTMLGIIIGVASVVIMVSVVQGQNRLTMEYYEKMGSNKIQVMAYGYYDTTGEISQKLYDYCLTMQDLVLGITPEVELNQKTTIQYGAKTLVANDWESMNADYSTMPHIKLGSDQYGLCNNYRLAGGRELSYLDIENTNNVCVLGGGMKESLFNYTDPVGEYITVNGQPFLVVGWYEKIDLEYQEYLDNIVVIPYTFNRTLNDNSPINQYYVKAKSATATVEAMTKLTAYLSGLFPKNEMGYSDVGDFQVYSDDSYVQDLQTQNNMQAMVLGGIAAISLLVGGIGIMNIMLVTVTERTREIGIKKAIGAQRSVIVSQFLVESTVLSGCGGVIGILIGYAGSLVLGKLIYDTITLPSAWMSAAAFAFSLVIGVGFGLYPAVKASGLQPVDALRAD